MTGFGFLFASDLFCLHPIFFVCIRSFCLHPIFFVCIRSSLFASRQVLVLFASDLFCLQQSIVYCIDPCGPPYFLVKLSVF